MVSSILSHTFDFLLRKFWQRNENYIRFLNPPHYTEKARVHSRMRALIVAEPERQLPRIIPVCMSLSGMPSC